MSTYMLLQINMLRSNGEENADMNIYPSPDPQPSDDIPISLNPLACPTSSGATSQLGSLQNNDEMPLELSYTDAIDQRWPLQNSDEPPLELDQASSNTPPISTAESVIKLRQLT